MNTIITNGSELDVAVVERFFLAIEKLVADKVIRGLKTYTDRYNLNRRNLQAVRNNPVAHTAGVRQCMLVYLIRDYRVSPYWLLLGDGDFYSAGFNADIVRQLQKTEYKPNVRSKQLTTA